MYLLAIPIVFFLLSVPIGLLVLSGGEASSVLNVYAVFVLSAWLLLCFFKSKVFFILSLYVILGLYSAVVIAFFLEQGVYLTEIREFSFASGLPAKSALQCFLFLAGSYLMIVIYLSRKIYVKNITKSSLVLCRWGGRAVIVLLILIMGYILIQYGRPTTHRMDYWANQAPAWGNTLVYFLIQMCLPLGFFLKEFKSKVEVLFFLLILGVIMTMGVRFTGIVVSIILFITPILIVSHQKINLLKMRTALIGGVLLSIVVLGIVLGFESYDSQSRSERLLTRVTLQPQTWWALDQQSDMYPKDIEEISRHYFGFNSQNDEKGMYYLMYKIAPSSVVDRYYRTGSSFALGGIFNNVYFFGYILGGFVNFFFGMLFGLTLAFLSISIYSNNIVATLISFRLSYKIQAIMLSGTVPNFFSTELLVLFLLFFIFVSKRPKIKLAETRCRTVV